jgi:hypothetical protein
MSGKSRWISVRKWRKFQHYDPAKRWVPWIKLYTELMSDDAFLRLTPARRCLLICLWLEYALSRSCLRLDVPLLNSRLGLAAKLADYEALKKAGFIAFVSSPRLAEGYIASSPRARPRADAETEESKGKNNSTESVSETPTVPTGKASNNGSPLEPEASYVAWEPETDGWEVEDD